MITIFKVFAITILQKSCICQYVIFGMGESIKIGS
jgi:hypothetical protein